MTDFEPPVVDPARRRIMEFHEEAHRCGRDYEPTAEELRLVMIEALPEAGGVHYWSQRLGCTPEDLQAVLDGEIEPAGDMLDILSMEPIPSRGVYADPLMDREARAIQRQRWSKGPTAATYVRGTPRRIERSAPIPEHVKNMFAIGVAAPTAKPKLEK